VSVGAMHSVEVADGYDCGAEGRGNFVDLVEDLHRSCLRDWVEIINQQFLNLYQISNSNFMPS
jgi:hypothetical protein